MIAVWWFRRLLIIPPILAGCIGIAGCADVANTRNFAVMGTVLGAGAGVALGAATGHVAEGVMLGAGIGGFGGGYAGQQMENMRRKKAEKQLLQGVEQDVLGGRGPSATPGPSGPGRYEVVKKSKWVDTSETKKVWVEEKLEDGKAIEPHFEDRVIPSGRWDEVEERVWVPDNTLQTSSASSPPGQSLPMNNSRPADRSSRGYSLP